jgi:hypothetical protein
MKKLVLILLSLLYLSFTSGTCKEEVTKTKQDSATINNVHLTINPIKVDVSKDAEMPAIISLLLENRTKVDSIQTAWLDKLIGVSSNPMDNSPPWITNNALFKYNTKEKQTAIKHYLFIKAGTDILYTVLAILFISWLLLKATLNNIGAIIALASAFVIIQYITYDRFLFLMDYLFNPNHLLLSYNMAGINTS